ncbi:hypothetical protein F7725_006935 [Dissostichus mawsoni]|uniref:Uncharacterized protein n=1 Tax=Dissostichus mawsoni TaxID=36200 RepID=A0A7J5XW93_DISMA|nr:hypothetical protein F7725_006935 [Dissostichus mawsoni]
MMMMKMMVMMFLSTATLMLGPAVAKPTHVPLDNLKAIIDIGNRTGSATKIWVEELTSLTGECKDKFFCKSYEILYKNKHHMQEGDEALLRNLKAYVVGTHANCERQKRGILIRNSFPNSGPKSSNVPSKFTCAVTSLLPHLRPSRQWISRVPECFFFILL